MIKRQILSEWIKNIRPNLKTPINLKGGERYTRLTLSKRNGVAIPISDRANFRAKKIMWDKVRESIMIKGLILQEDERILNGYAPKNIKIHEAETHITAKKNP